jgi:DNA-binding transcriptional regulator/RsmH inhibitor MraZ
LRPAFEGLGGYLAKGQEGCLALWPHERYEERLALLEARADTTEDKRDRARVRLFASAEHAVPDVQGRIAVAPYLQEWAGLDPAKVLVRGANRIVELWNVARWEELESLAEQDLLGVPAEAS